MKVLKEADKAIAKILGRQKIKETEYRRALWIIEEGDLLHNTLTGELLELDGSETEEELIAGRYLVPAELDEISFIKEWRNVFRLVTMPGHKKSYTVLPTTACNARCFYCYEKGIEFNTMSDEVIQQLIERIASDNKREVSLNWFGGEPLIGIKQIDAICSGLKGRGLEISSKMISNGYLFDEQLIDKAVKLWNLKRVQITLDGTEEVYNSVKNYINPDENPFRRVLKNITLLTDAGVRVNVRLNLGGHNYEDLKNLIPVLEGIKHENLSVYCKTINQEVSEENDIRCGELMDMLADKGLRSRGRGLSKLKVNACMSDNENSFLIDPLGAICKCEHHISDGIVGNIWDGVSEEKAERFKEYSVPEGCRQCPLAPSCILLNVCQNSESCSGYERNRRIEETKITMRNYLMNSAKENSENTEDSGESVSAC